MAPSEAERGRVDASDPDCGIQPEKQPAQQGFRQKQEAGFMAQNGGHIAEQHKNMHVGI